MNTNTQDPLKIQRGLLTLFLAAVSVFLAWFGLSHGMPALGLAIPAIAVVSWMFGRPERLLLMFLFVGTANLMVPGLTKTIGLPQIFQVLIMGWAILDTAILHQKRQYSYRREMDRWMGIFAANMLLIMLMRGSGFRVLGSSTYGGTGYLMLFLAIGFYFAAVRIKLNGRGVKSLLWLLFIAALIPGVTEILLNFSGGLSWVTKFVSTNIDQLLSEGVEEVGGVKRWASVASVGAMLIPLAFVLCRKTGLRIVLLLVSLSIVAVSGFRGRTFAMAIIIFGITLYDSKNRTKTVFLWMLVGLAGLGFLMIAAPMLPRAIQRAVSFIPFIPVDAAIADRAAHSSNWRFELWHDYCIPNVPKYLLIGRGIAHDITQFAWLQSSWYGSSDFFYYMGRYHSGPFSLLLDFGLAGTVSFSVFFIMAVVDGWKTIRRFQFADPNPVVFRYYVYLTVYMTYQLFGYYLVFGDVRESLPKMLIIVVQMRILKKNFLEEAADADVQVVQSVETVRRTSLKPLNRWGPGQRSNGVKRLNG